MASHVHTTARHAMRILVAAIALTALTAGTAGASTPALTQIAAPESNRAGSSYNTRPRTEVPGFLRDRGRFIKFDAPKAVGETAPNSINNRGQIAGAYYDASRGIHGFLRDKAGRFTTIDVPGAKGTGIYKINDLGQIVGRYSQTHANIQDPDSVARGFLLDRGKLTRIDVPGAAETQAVGINNFGQVVGEYQTRDGAFHGFLWHKGRFVTIDKPGATASSLIDINDRGQILGAFAGNDGVLHNFLLDRGRYTTFDAPGVGATWARDINNRGQIAGFTVTPDETDPLAGARGFVLAKGVKGPYTPVDVPGAPRNLVSGLNDRAQIVGVYENTAASPSTQRDSMPMGPMSSLGQAVSQDGEAR